MRLRAASCMLGVMVAVAGCEREPQGPVRQALAPSASASPAGSAVRADTTASASSTPLAPPAASASASAPVKVERSGKVWPFHKWSRAEAVTFNQFQDRPGVPLVAYDDTTGWSPHLVDRKPLDAAQGAKAVDFVKQTNGDVSVSKCPFPRHAVVLYDDALPVATINVCFACGDILLWPRWEPEPNWEKMSAKEMKEVELRQAKQMKLYEAVFPKWKTFFRDELGFSIDASYRR